MLLFYHPIVRWLEDDCTYRIAKRIAIYPLWGAYYITYLTCFLEILFWISCILNNFEIWVTLVDTQALSSGIPMVNVSQSVSDGHLRISGPHLQCSVRSNTGRGRTSPGPGTDIPVHTGPRPLLWGKYLSQASSNTRDQSKWVGREVDSGPQAYFNISYIRHLMET